VNRQLTIGGVFITMADTRLTHTKEMIATAQQVLGGKIRVFETIVRMNAPVKEAPIVGQSILTYDPTSTGAVSYKQLAQELIS
jgi:chromosome partitioning protein